VTFYFHKVAYVHYLGEVDIFFIHEQKKFLPLYNSAKIIKIDRDFPKLRSQMYCHLFYGSQCTGWCQTNVYQVLFSLFKCADNDISVRQKAVPDNRIVNGVNAVSKTWACLSSVHGIRHRLYGCFGARAAMVKFMCVCWATTEICLCACHFLHQNTLVLFACANANALFPA